MISIRKWENEYENRTQKNFFLYYQDEEEKEEE
jgi:hypothetical protein